MASSTEGAELKFVSSIRYKFAGASGDDKKLSDALNSHLVPLVGKAGSQYKAVRDATFQAFISVNNFVKPTGVILPVAALVDQYKKTSSPMVKQLDLNLIKQGITRLDQSKRRELLPIVLRGISKETNPISAAGFFNIFLRLLLDIKIPGRGSNEDIALREQTGLSDPVDAGYISQWLGKLFLLRQDLALAKEEDLDIKLRDSPSGLSLEDVAFLRNKNPLSWHPSNPSSLSLSECKIKAVSFLASGAFTDSERHIPTICAAGSADSRITSIADDILKRSSVDLENKIVVKALYDAHKKLPPAQRTQILKLLSKSVIACSFNDDAVETAKQDFNLGPGRNASVLGLEASRLNKALLAFLGWIARNSSSSTDRSNTMGPSLVLILKDYILGQGWPEPAVPGNIHQIQDELKLRANAYETIGVLARGSLFEYKAKDSLLKWLFDSLVSDPSPDIVVYIESALSSMMGLFKPTNPAETRDLEILLLEYMALSGGQGGRTARHIAARFANNSLPYSNVKARWIDILALGGGSTERRDVLEEGQRGLDPWWATKLNPDDALVLPDWEKLAEMFFNMSRKEDENRMDVDQTSKYTLFPNNCLQAFPVAIHFIKKILFLTALGEDKFEVDWESQLERNIENDLATRDSIRQYFATSKPDSLLKILNAALDGIRDHPDVGAEECISCVAEILSFAPSKTVISPLSARTRELIPLIKSNNQKVRQLASKTFGILAPWSNESAILISQLRNFVESNMDPSASQSAEYQGSLACLGSYFSRAAYYGKFKPQDVSEHAQFLYESATSTLEKASADIKATALDSISQLWTANVHFPVNDDELTKIIDSLAKLAASGNEKAITALGRLAIPSLADVSGNDTEPVAKILDKLFGLSEIKRTEIHFAIGEAIACAISRWDSEAVQLSLDVEPSGTGKSDIIEALGNRPSRIDTTINKLITDCKTTKPSLLKASGIWLFCVIQYCSNLPQIQSRLRECQVAFMRLLTARDELVQETASRGLALVYEKGDESLKGDLVKDLVASFTGTKTQLKVDEDTELFDAGALPTGEGKSITSYKDIISLANEVGDQSLIYKFMALATNAATWTARSAFGRFGLSNILSDAELDPKIYPKLYRYRFDPNSNVRRSMDDIWKAVVKDQTVVIDTHFDAIMNDLLKSILDGKEWRVREASCAAIAELIYGQKFPKYEKYYTDIWKATLRVLDDQKTSVREAALKLCMGLSKTLVTQLQENNSSSSAKAMITQVVPFLLSDKGIENSAKEVKSMSIITVLDVVKNGGDALKPFIATIITHCLGLLSTVEHEAVNYYYQRVSEEDREGLDKLRSTFATRSPIFECVVDCLRFVDEDVMKELAPQLISTIKSAIGMQTKIGCGEVLNTLALRHSILLPPYNATFLKAMETQILDRNHETSKAYARSAAYLLRSASIEVRDRFTSRLLELYFGAEDDTRRQKVADAVLAIAKISPDAFTDLEARLLPFAYFAKHDTDEYVSEEFAAAWNQHAGGSHSVKRFVDEITQIVSRGLDTSKWALQHGAALTTASMVTALSSAAGKDGQFADTELQKIWPVLDKALALKTFKGKEKLVTAYPLFVLHGKKLWNDDSAFAAQLKKIAIREAKRNNDEYRPHAIAALAEFASAREDLDMYAEVVSLVSQYLKPDDETHKVTELERRTAEAALKADMTAYNRQKMQATPVSVLGEVITTMEGAKQAILMAKDTWFTSTTEIMNQASKSEGSPDPTAATVATRWFRLLVANENDIALESQRTSRAKSLDAFVKAWKKGVFGSISEQGSLREEMEQKLKAMAEADRSIDVQKLLGQVAQQLVA
ncbi:proteasome component [Annulohypoxylon maeteangense]|uniref:proteasome component n=1 Tax=Annulohypoxylon maeteangense TaxID=1927788 RepID=UPI002007B5A9|nr:proteasome component [Annulohypoxylon maeteangense]KAI0889639.1 proteasome component [Annulohypoxylon maeteangense]